MPHPSERPAPHAPRHRRGVTRAALAGALLVLLAVTALQVLGAARFIEAGLGGSGSSWAPALLVLLGGGLSAALLLVVGHALATDLRTRPRRSRQDASRGQPDSPSSPDSSQSSDALDAVIARSRGIPAQRVSAEDRPQNRSEARPQDGPRPRGRGGVHRSGPD